MKVKVADLEFEILITEAELKSKIASLGQEISKDYADKKPLFLGVLNGSFIFMADLVREVSAPGEVTFTKLASYFGGTATLN